MKTNTTRRNRPGSTVSFILFVTLGLTLAGCSKDVSNSGTPDSLPTGINPGDTVAAKSAAELTQSLPFPQSLATNCDYSPDYGQKLIQPQPTNGNDYTVSPINNKDVSGSYIAWPGGLSIDAKTGTIDVTRSETGARYAVGFVRTGGTDTCMSYITLGGADYIDSIYTSEISTKTAPPHFDANVSGPSPCAGSGCKFDYNHSAKKMGVYVDEKNGAIDIKNTLKHSIFAVFPIDGNYFYTTIQYKAHDASNDAAQSIQVKLIYYNSRSSIPASLVQTIAARANNINTGDLGETGMTRPPIIIITRAQ